MGSGEKLLKINTLFRLAAPGIVGRGVYLPTCLHSTQIPRASCANGSRPALWNKWEPYLEKQLCSNGIQSSPWWGTFIQDFVFFCRLDSTIREGVKQPEESQRK